MASNQIQFDIYSCVRTYFKDSSCTKCEDVCPVEDTIFIEKGKVNLKQENCVSCGGCVGVCPTEVFSLKGFSPENFFEKMVENGESLISCKSNVPCLSSIDVQYLVSLAIRKDSDIILDKGHCSECFIGSLITHIEKNVEEANYILETLDVPHRIKLEDIKYEPPKQEEQKKERRDFLKRFSKTTAGLAFWMISQNIPQIENLEEEKDEDYYKNIVEEKVFPKKREILIKTLKESGIDFKDKELEVDKISFTSQKWMDTKKCTNCMICMNICPTGALQSGKDRLQILFQPSECIKCRICHEVCPEECLHLAEKLSVDDFVNNTVLLAEHVMIPCAECLVPFSYKGDSVICPRCRQLEDEIKDLLKIGE